MIQIRDEQLENLRQALRETLEKAQSMPLPPPTHTYCCHTDIIIRKDESKVCSICHKQDHLNPKREEQYKPREDAVKLYCCLCDKEYHISPSIFEIKKERNDKMFEPYQDTEGNWGFRKIAK